MKRLDRYIFVRFLKAVFFVIFVVSLLVSVIDYTEKIDEFIEHQLPYTEILHYYATLLPFIIGYVAPLIVFIASVFLTSNLASHTEIVAIASSGMSFVRFLRPYFFASLLLAVLNFFLYGWLMPEGNKFRVSFENAYIKNPFMYEETNVHYKVGKESYLYFHYYDTYEQRAEQVKIERIVDGALKERRAASYMLWDSSQHKWLLRDWQLRVLEDTTEVLSSGDSLALDLQISPRDFQSDYGLTGMLTSV